MGASVEDMKTPPPPRPSTKDEQDSLLSLTLGSKDERDAQPVPYPPFGTVRRKI